MSGKCSSLHRNIAIDIMNLQLSIGITNNPRTWPIIDGTVKADGIDLIPTVLHPSELFWRQLHFSEFAVSEMSCSSFLIAVARGDARFVGLPIFTTRRFFHTSILVRRKAGIETPADLKGKRVGVPEYQQTAALWARGVLQHEFGVAPKDMEFWMERTPEMSHGGATGFKAPPGVTVHQIPADKSIGAMMLAGELDAVLHYLSDRNLVDRSRADLASHPDFRYLFPDPIAEGVRFYKKTGLLPINHQAVVRRDIFEKEPWVVLNLIKAFNKANEIADAQRVAHVQDHLAAGLLSGDPKQRLLHHGVKANRKVIETIAQYSLEQNLTPRLMKIEELYAPSALDT
jgi:4,5-dihydroxyphthalate decarboxylase